MANLREALEVLKKEDRASFHMPGHKYGGCGLKDSFDSFWDIDITEIPGADNLHDPEEILLEAKRRAEEAYGARESFFLVNGSSCGIMAMIMGTVKRGEKVLISRDAHRSIHHAVALGGLHPVYLMPKIDPVTGIAIGLDERALEGALREYPDIKAVVCTYPSYSGACSDLSQIRRITKDKGVQLLVDEAHGAHLWLSESLPPSALALGADVVVQSLHKTMPAMTQTAILHLGSEEARRADIAHYLTVFQSSSPSYVLLSSIDEAIGIGRREGKELMTALLKRISAFKTTARNLGFELWDGSSLPQALIWAFDDTKLALSGHMLGLDGYSLDERLRAKGIQSEYAVRSHVLLMTGIANREADFHRLERALGDIAQEMRAAGASELTLSGCHDDFTELTAELAVLPGDVVLGDSRTVALAEAVGQVAWDWVIPYPPGVPMLCPGERISDRHLTVMAAYLEQGHKMLGIKDGRIRILTD